MTDRYGFYELAGLCIKVQGAGEQLYNRMSEYLLPLPKEGEQTFRLGLFIQKTADEIPAIQEGHYVGTHGNWQLYDTEKGQSACKYLESLPDVLGMRTDFFEDQANLSLLSLEESDAAKREYVYSGIALSQMMLSHDRLVLHSSCIAVDGQAVLFSAPSGTGKSTHTGLWEKYVENVRYINDDTPILRLDQKDAVYACGSPWSGSTELQNNLSVPLKAIVLLERGEKNEISSVEHTEAFARIFGETRKLPFKKTINKAAELCDELICRVPVYRLTCNISKEAVEIVKHTIFCEKGCEL